MGFFLFEIIGGHTIFKHSTTPRTSPQKVEVAKIEVLGAEKVDTGMIRAHGKIVSYAAVNLLVTQSVA